MIFIVDAHLPISVCHAFIRHGAKAIHTSELELGNATPDKVIREFANQENGTVVTKDSDFFHSFVLKKGPSKLILVKIGNVRLQEVRTIFDQHAEEIIRLIDRYDLIGLHADKLIAIE